MDDEKQKIAIDQNGEIITYGFENEENYPENTIINAELPQGFFKPIWNSEKENWVEGLTDEEIKALKEKEQEHQEQQEPELPDNTEDIELLKQENRTLKQQIAKQEERQEMLEMAILEVSDIAMMSANQAEQPKKAEQEAAEQDEIIQDATEKGDEK